jgi:hypothetical protein
MASKAPDPTPPKETSAATTGTNVSTAIANSFLGNVNQVTPDGTLTYDQTGSYQWNDPYTGQSYTIPRFTATQTLSPQQQAIKDQTNSADLNLATLANTQSGFLNDYMAKPFSYSTGDYENWAGFDPKGIVYAGVGKRDKELRYAIEQDILAINCESIEELELVDALAGEAGRVADVALRINPDIDPKTNHCIDTGQADSKFGISYEEVLEHDQWKKTNVM